MNDLCFKTQKEFDKAKQEFVEFPDDMYNIFNEYHKTIQDNPSPVRKMPLRNILMKSLQNC